jgi:hypothetical protein
VTTIHTPVHEFKFPEPGPDMFTLTCKNHPTARYLTKNPWQRGLHFIQPAEGFRQNEECPCPFDDLVVVTETACPCECHDGFGGAHPNESCSCKQ